MRFLFPLTLLLFFAVTANTAPLKILIYSGTFDPPHSGHILTVERAAKQLGTEETFIIPNVSSDHKTGVSDYLIRKEESKIAFANVENAHVADPELEQAFLENDMTGVIEKLRGRFPGAELYLVMGSDSYPRFLKATGNQKIENLTVAVVDRAGTEALAPVIPQTKTVFLDLQVPEISSSAIKKKIASGSTDFPEEPQAVLDYIKTHHLYGYLDTKACMDSISKVIP